MNYKTIPDDILIYFETIRDINPKSVIDVGLMLMRENVISRQAGDIHLPDGTMLCGLQTDSEEPFPIYHAVYDELYKSVPGKEFELMIYIPEKTEALDVALSIKSEHILTRLSLASAFVAKYDFSNINKVSLSEHEYVVMADRRER
mgnify:CR=1 FL=1